MALSLSDAAKRVKLSTDELKLHIKSGSFWPAAPLIVQVRAI